MKEVTAFKSKSGDLYNTAEEARVKDVEEAISDLFIDKDTYCGSMYDVIRIKVIR